MFVKEIWRYPVKSLAGERVQQIEVGLQGFAGDRTIHVERRGRIVTSRTDHKLLGLHATLDATRGVLINGHPWNSPQALALVKAAAGPDAELVKANQGLFDVLPLLVATDGAIAHMNMDSRRFRPNLIIGAVDSLAERTWPGRQLRIGDVRIDVAQLRGRCVMTTYDPDTLKQDLNVLKRIVKELGGKMALDCAVVSPGVIAEGPEVFLED